MEAKTDLNDIILSTSHINADHYNKTVFMLLSETDQSVDMIGAQYTQDISYYAVHFGLFDTSDINPDKFILLKVVPHDPRDLPFELPRLEDAYIIYDDWYMSNPLGTMKEVTEKIEELFRSFDEAKIEEFAVLIGREMSNGVKTAVLRQIEYNGKRNV